MKIKFKKLHPDAQLPTKSEGDLGYDLFYCGDDVTVIPGKRVGLSTGISWEPESGLHGIIYDRSGLSVKHGLHRLAGIIDNRYRGPLIVCLVNLDFDFRVDASGAIVELGSPYTIKKGDRIAQLIIQQEVPTEIEWAEELTETERGTKGFGASGR